MKQRSLATLITLLFATQFIGCSSFGEIDDPIAETDFIQYVDPFVDTHKSRWFYFSSACRPFGMVNLSPDTDIEGSWGTGYLYDTEYIRCFSHIHGWQLSGLAVLPITGEMKGHLGAEAYKSAFSHDQEIAKPGYHQVVLSDYNIEAELTSTCRVGFHKYSFRDKKKRHIIFDTGARLAHGDTKMSGVEKVSDTELKGYAVMSPTWRRSRPLTVYFVVQFDQPFTDFGGWEKSKLKQRVVDGVSGKDAGAFVSFPEDISEVKMKLAISYTSYENAVKNLDSELSHWDFEKVKQNSFDEWNQWLGKIKVKGGTEEQTVKLYTDLWHALLGRRIMNDANGSYIDNTGKRPVIRNIPMGDNEKPAYNHYNFDALWGTHWSLNILWSMAYPKVMEEFCQTMLDMYDNGGMIPRGPSGGNYTYVMIGDPAAPFFASAYHKGINNFDIQKAYEGLRKNAFVGGIRDHAGYEHRVPAYGGGMQYYVKQGWVPEGIDSEGIHKDGASMTLEYAYQDWCLSQLAKSLDHQEDYELLSQRSLNYKNQWNPDTRYMHPREIDGSWIKDFEPVQNKHSTRGFCEANSAVYTNFVPHDMAGLIELFGGKEHYVEFLNSSFEKEDIRNLKDKNKNHAAKWIDYGNQPSTGMAHLFNHAGSPWLTQKWVRYIKDVYGDTTPYGGYNGDEDQGQMGALGVLMAIGLFEVDGGAAEKPSYEISTPLFDRVEIELDPDYYPGGNFVIECEKTGEENIYIQQAKLNKRNWNNQCWFYHDDFIKGGKLKLVLGDEPNKNWGIKVPPPSLSFVNKK